MISGGAWRRAALLWLLLLPGGVAALDFKAVPALTPTLDKLTAGWKVLYVLDPLAGLSADQERCAYLIDRSRESRMTREVGYLLYLEPENGSPEYVWTYFPAPAFELKKLGVPTVASGAVFQRRVGPLSVVSNRPGVPNGRFRAGALEFWPCSYYPAVAMRYPGASEYSFDFDDQRRAHLTPGYGSMQVHNLDRKSTVFAFNRWRDGRKCDLGIGNASGPNPDWTGTASAVKIRFARLAVYTREP